MRADGEAALVAVAGLSKDFVVRRPGFLQGTRTLRAVDGVSLEVARGETLAVVGESGCGKTTLGRTILRLYEPTSGTVRLDRVDVTTLGPGALRQARRRMQMVFQDPHASLDPRMTVGSIIAEPLLLHGLARRGERRDRVAELLELVDLDPRHAGRYPHEFSGGQRQRIGIARALALQPDFLVLDEPISALDVSIQAQIVNLLLGLQDRLGLTYLFISHDMNIVRHVANDVGVMYLGRLVELASREALFADPLHPYTLALLSAICVPDPRRSMRADLVIEHDPPSPLNPPSGCHFHPRCRFARDVCRTTAPPLRMVGGNRHVACHLVQDDATPRRPPDPDTPPATRA